MSRLSGVLPADMLPLRAHPTERVPIDLCVSAALAVAGSRQGPGWLLHYRLVGDIAALALPAPAASTPEDGLWHHTCLEAFVQDGDGPGYHEFNISPSGQWAVYRFSDERLRVADDTVPTHGPVVHTGVSDRELTLQVWIPRALLPLRPTAVGLTAVIETLDGQIGHWALHHPRSDRPDFHHPAGRTHRPSLPPFPHATPTA